MRLLPTTTIFLATIDFAHPADLLSDKTNCYGEGSEGGGL